MINLGSGKIKDLRLGSEKISKAYLGDRLVFSKGGGIVDTSNSLTFYTTTKTSPFAKNIDITDDIYNKIRGKKNMMAKIEDHNPVSCGTYVEYNTKKKSLKFEKSLDELIGVSDWIEIGTKIVVTFD